MPATAGRVRMPANNRVHSSAALQTSDMWQTVIKYDPYAPTNKQDFTHAQSEGENPYTSFQTLMDIAKLSSFDPNESRGACKRCGRVGHLTFQCRNFLSLKEKDEQDRMQSWPEKIEASKDESEDEEEEEIENSDSDVDSEIERIIAKRNGNGEKKSNNKRRSSSSSKKGKKGVCDEDGSDSDCGGRKRGRSKKRRSNKKKRDSSDSESEEEARRKNKKERDNRRKRNESCDEKQRRHERKSVKEKA